MHESHQALEIGWIGRRDHLDPGGVAEPCLKEIGMLPGGLVAGAGHRPDDDRNLALAPPDMKRSLARG